MRRRRPAPFESLGVLEMSMKIVENDEISRKSIFLTRTGAFLIRELKMILELCFESLITFRTHLTYRFGSKNP